MSPEHRRVMRSRQIFVTLSAVFCVVGTLFGTGVIGTRVAEPSGGDLAADATLIAPAGTAFSIWSLIYLGLLAYTIRQWLTPFADTPRHRVTAGLAAISMILNALWLLVTQVGWIGLSVLVIVALLLTLGLLAARLLDRPEPGISEFVVVDGTFGLYLGWVCVAVCANIAAALVGWGLPSEGALAVTATIVVLAVVVAVAWFLGRRLGGNWFVAAGITWGLAWVGVARLTDDPRSTPVGIAALAAAAAVLFVTWRGGQEQPADRLYRGNHRDRGDHQGDHGDHGNGRGGEPRPVEPGAPDTTASTRPTSPTAAPAGPGPAPSPAGPAAEPVPPPAGAEPAPGASTEPDRPRES